MAPLKHTDPCAESEVTMSHLRGRAKHLMACQEFGKAAALLGEAILRAPDSYKLHRLRAMARGCLRDYQASLEDAEVVVGMNPDSPDGHYQRGFALYHLGRFGEAARAFGDALDICPRDRVIRQAFWDALALLTRGRGAPAGSRRVPGRRQAGRAVGAADAAGRE